jgi:surface antigen
MLAFGVSGCAVSGFGSMFGKQDRDAAQAYASEDVTGSVGASRLSPTSSASGLPSETDLVFTRMAVVDVLTRGSKEVSAPWENPSSGARGTVTPIASAYTRDGSTCRDFLASYVRLKGAESWMQGEACRSGKGRWEVKSLRPWTRS